jgi:predicted Zn-dependent protease with MMP-like domain
LSGRAERLRVYRALRQRYRPDRRTFERLVAEVVETLPAPFKEKLANVAVVVLERPTGAELRSVALDPSADDLLGLYHGMPYGERGTGYHLVPPDRITIYRQPILQMCRTEAEVRDEIRDTVLHEIGHYFGLSDQEMEQGAH